MSFKDVVATGLSYVGTRIKKLALWLDGVLASPPLDESDARRRWEDDSVFQPRDF
jgi:hypothetical protein